jgi:ribonuclease J
MEQLGRNTPLYATAMAYELIKLKQADMKATLPKLSEYVRYRPVQMGKHFQITPFVVDHSIPDSVGLLIETPVGRFVHTGDWKFDKTPLPNRPSTNYEWIESLGNRGVRGLFSDSTNAHLLGSSISESAVIHSIEEIFEKSPGRVITATFSSIIDRVMLIISTSEKYNRKVVLLGRSMNNYIDIAIKLGYVRPKPGTIISMADAAKLPDNEVTICCTGAQGERYAALMRIVTGESKDTTLKPDDVIIFSSSVIPGNERAVQGLFDLITQQGPKIHHYKESEIHAGGHAKEEDTKKMIGLLRPEFYIPIYGFPHMLRGNARNAYDLGFPKSKVPILRNGKILEFTKDSMRETDQYASKKLITVDGRMVGYTTEKELHDRYQISSQ